MKLTDKELNFVLSECIKNLMLENTPTNTSNTFDKKYIQQMVGKKTDPSSVERDKYTGSIDWVRQGNKPNVSGKKWGNAGAKAATGVAGLQALKYGGKFAMGALGSLAPSLVGLGALIGGGALVVSFFNNVKVLNKFKNLELPTIAMNVPKYAKLAVQEKVKAQQICIELQKELNTSIAAFNKCFNSNKTLDDVLNNAEVEFRDAKQNGNINKAKINKNIDFTNKYAGKNESRIKDNLLEGVGDLQKKIAFFRSENMDMYIGEQNLTEIGVLYKRAYGNWMEWVRYIQALAKKFPKQCNWEDMMDGKTQSNTPLGRITNAVKDKLQNTFSAFDTGESLDDDSTDNKLILVVINTDWKYTTQEKQMGNKNPTEYSGILVQQQDKGVLYCITNNMIGYKTIQQGDIIQYNYEQSDIYSKAYRYNDVVSQQPTKNPQIAWLLYKEANEQMEILYLQ